MTLYTTLLCGSFGSAYGQDTALEFSSAAQSSTAYSGAPNRAIDGNTNGNYRRRSVTHTQTETQPWWTGDLGDAANISEVKLWNRTNRCCRARLSDFYILISEFPFSSESLESSLNDPAVWSSFHAGALSGTTYAVPAGVVGRYVRVQLAGRNPLSLAEVVVTGSPLDPNIPPVAEDDEGTVESGAEVSIAVLTNDSDSDSTAALTVALEINPTVGNALVQPDGTILYTAPEGILTETLDSFTYTATDDAGDAAEATVRVTITPANIPPVAEDDEGTVESGAEVSIAVLANDSDSDSTAALTVALETNPTVGNALVQPDGTILYTAPEGIPAETFDSFTYTASDEDGATATATVSITITPAIVWGNVTQIVPVVVSQSSTSHGGVPERAIDGNTNGHWRNRSVTHTKREAQPWWTADLGELANLAEIDIWNRTNCCTARLSDFYVLVSDAPFISNDLEENLSHPSVWSSFHAGTLANASVSIPVEVRGRYIRIQLAGTNPLSLAEVIVSGALPAVPNIPPVAVDDAADVEAGGSTTIAVLDNDTDQDGDVTALTVTATDGTLGTVAVDSKGSITYSNHSGVAGDTDTFTYSITDDAGDTDSATVTLTLTAPPNIPPVASDDTADVEAGGSTTIAVLDNDTDQDGDVTALTVTATDGTLGTVAVEDDGSIIYSNQSGVAGDTDTFTYTITDDAGDADSATVTLTLTAPPNIPPVASDDAADVEAGGTTTIAVLDNDTDQDGDVTELTVTATDGTLGTVAVGDDGSITYSNQSGVAGDTDTFAYTITDDAGDADSASVLLTLTAPPAPPIAVDDAVSIAAGAPGTIDVLSNDGDAAEAIVAAGPLQPSHGAISINPINGEITYTADHMASIGTVDQFSYTLENLQGLLSDPATVTVTLVPGAMIHTHHEMVPNPAFASDLSVADACRADQICHWDTPSTWATGSVPTSHSRVIVDGNVQIRDSNAIAQSVVVYPGGKLTFATNTDTELKVGDLLVLTEGLLEIGSAESPISSHHTAQVTFRDLPFDANDPAQYLRGLVTLDGTVRVHGHAFGDVFIRTELEPLTGTDTLALTKSAISAGWSVGDSVVIPTSRQCAVGTGPASVVGTCPDETEDRTITAISGDGLTLTLDQALQFDHPGARNHLGWLDFTPHVINKSRNVIFASENPDGVRGQLLLHGRTDADIRYAELRSLGRTNIDDLGPDNQKGRYPLHAHHLIGPLDTPANGYQFSFVGNTIDFGAENRQQDRKWGISIHGSHYGLIERNIVDHASGAAIVTESGSELGNQFTENFVVRVIGGNGAREHDPDPGDGSKLGRSGSAYWFNGGGRNFFHNNIAAAVAECIYCYGFKFDNQYTDDVAFPVTQGADPHIAGGEILSPYVVGLNNFVGNEAYAVPNGLTVWWECSFGDYPRDNCSSHIDNFQVWHHHRWGYYGYPTNNMTLSNFVMRGDPSIMTNRYETPYGMNFSDYMSRNTTIVNADIQNMRIGIQLPSMRDVRNASGPDVGFITIQDSYLVSTVGLLNRIPSSVNGAANLPPQTAIVRDVEFVSIDPSQQLDMAHIQFSDRTYFLKNPTLRNDVWMYGYYLGEDETGEPIYKDLYLVPAYEGQGPASCDNSIGDCGVDLTDDDEYIFIDSGHVYPLR